MSDNTNQHESENEIFVRRPRPRLWNPKDDNDERLQAYQVMVAHAPRLSEDRPQIMISNAIKQEDLPQCRPRSECKDIHPADRVYYDTKDDNNRHRLLHDKWNEHDIKVFTTKYQNLQSNKDKKFDLIAKALPNKTSADCREFYYLYKHILEFKIPERERKQKENERKQSLLQLKEPCTSRLRSGRSLVLHDETPRANATPSKNARVGTTPTKKYSLTECSHTKRPVFVCTHSKSETLLADLNNAEESITSLVPSASSSSDSLSNLNLLADVCNVQPRLESKANTQLSEDKITSKQQHKRKRSHKEEYADSNTDCKHCYLDNETKDNDVTLPNHMMTQENTESKHCYLDNKTDNDITVLGHMTKVHSRKRKRQGDKNTTRLGRAVKCPHKMDL